MQSVHRAGLAGAGVVAVGVAVIVAISGESDPGNDPLGGGPMPASCVATTFDPSEPGATVLERVHFPGYATRGWEQGDELQSELRGDGVRFAKQAIEVHGPSLVVFQVPRKSRRSVSLVGWGADAGRSQADSIRIKLGDSGRCSGIWPGGFLFKRDQCFKLSVRAGGDVAEVAFGLGESCESRHGAESARPEQS